MRAAQRRSRWPRTRARSRCCGSANSRASSSSKGTRHLCHYETGYGSVSLGVAADVIEQRLDENGGSLKFSYTLDSGAESFISRNLVDITVDKLPEA